MRLHSPESAILSAVIFNALIIVALIPLALRGVRYRPGERGGRAAAQPAALRRRRDRRAVHRHQAHRRVARRPQPRLTADCKESHVLYCCTSSSASRRSRARLADVRVDRTGSATDAMDAILLVALIVGGTALAVVAARPLHEVGAWIPAGPTPGRADARSTRLFAAHRRAARRASSRAGSSTRSRCWCSTRSCSS